MKITAKLAAVNLFMAAATMHLYAQGNFDLDNKQSILVKKTYWSKESNDDTNNLNIMVINKAKRAIKYIAFEIVANDEHGTRLELRTGYSKKLSSNKKLPANSTYTYYFSNISTTPANLEEVQISNIHINYEDGSVENIRLEVK